MREKSEIRPVEIRDFIAFLTETWQSGLTVCPDAADPMHSFLVSAPTRQRIAVLRRKRIAPEDVFLLQTVRKQWAEKQIPLVVLADGFSGKTAAALHEHEINYFRSRNCVFLRWPGFTCIVQRPTPPSQRQGPAENTIFAGKGSRLCRLLINRPGYAWRQYELAAISGLTRGYVSQLAKRMVAENILQETGGRYRLTDRQSLIDAWSKVYRFQYFVRRQRYAVNMRDYPDGLRKVGGALIRLGVDFAFTGWSSAVLRAPYAEPPEIMVYTSEIPEKIPLLFPVESGGNVTLYQPHDLGRLQEKLMIGELPAVCDIQTYLDLKKMPGRADDQAEYFRDRCLNGE